MTGFFSFSEAPPGGFFGGNALPPFPPVSAATKEQIRDQADQRLAGLGRDLVPAARMAGRVPEVGGILGPALTIVDGLLKDPTMRGWVSQFLAASIGKDIDAAINRANNAYGQQLFLNSGGVPHR
jgi:hypothetical protein